MAAPAAPTIVSAVRSAADPTMLQVTVSVPVSGVTQMRLYERGASGSGVIIFTGMPAGGGVITAKSRYAANASVSVAASLRTSAGWSAVSGYTNVSAFTVAAPNLLSATRVAPGTVVELAITGLIPGAIGRIYRAAPGKPPAPIGNPWTIVGSTLPDATAPAPDGNAKYVYAVLQTHHGVASPLSTTRQVDEWWQTPPAVSLGTPSRSTSTGNVTIPISHPTYTPRNQPTGLRVFRARKGGAKPSSAYRTVTGRPTSWADTSTTLAHDYDYWFESYGPAGPSSSAPRVSVDAVREAPNPATSPSLTQLPDERFKLDWSINATTVRPITSQDIIVRTPGQTATAVFQSLGGSTTTTTLTPTANTIRQVGVLTRNAVGAAASVVWASGVMVGTPRNTDSLTGSWVAGGVQVQWSRRSSIGDELQIEFSTEAVPDRDNPAEWFPLGDYDNWTTTTYSALLSGASSLVPHTFRARAIHTDSGIASDWIYSARVDAQAAPHAPTMEMPAVLDATGGITLRAQHNPVDGTPVTAAQIRFRVQGSSTWITRTISNPATGISTVVAIGTNGQSLEVQGRTAGATGVYGPWGHVTDGASLLVPLRAKPTAVITSPTAGVYESQTMRLEWTASEQATASLELWDDTGGDLILLGTATVGPDVREHVWSDVVLRDGRDIIAEVLVHDGWQAAETQTVTVTVSYNLPAPPLLRAEPGPDASVILFATPINQLRTTRVNLIPEVAGWEHIFSTPTPAQTATLSDGTDTVLYPGIGDLDSATIDHAGTVEASVEVTRMPGTSPAWAALATAPADHQGESPGPSNDIPVWPETRVLTHQTFPPFTPFRLRVTSGTPAGPFHLVRAAVKDLVGNGDIERPFFDGDTVDPEGRYIYGWAADGTAYEAVPDAAGDRAVAATERVTIWCSRDGETWDECGETSTDWSFHDRLPAIGVPLLFRARAHAASGAWADSPVVEWVVHDRDVWVHFGADHRESVRGGSRSLNQRGGGLDVVAEQYEGHTHYTAHTGDQPVADSIDVDLQLLPATGASSLEAWKRALQHADIIYREPGGIVMRGVPILEGRTPESRYRQALQFSVLGTHQ